jgi:hypothetical protein
MQPAAKLGGTPGIKPMVEANCELLGRFERGWSRRPIRCDSIRRRSASSAKPDARTVSTIRPGETIRKYSLNLLVKKATRPQNVGYVPLDQAGRYSVFRLPLPWRNNAMLTKPGRAASL